MQPRYAGVMSQLILTSCILLVFVLTTYYYSGAYYLPPSASAAPYLHDPWGSSLGNFTILLHATDFHISAYDGGEARRVLRAFIEGPWKAIRPAGVIASGDLVNAKVKIPLGIGWSFSRQMVEEWAGYESVLKFGGVKEGWLDVRGNHDTFGVSKLGAEEDLFIKYGRMGVEEGLKRVYVKHLEGVRIVAVQAAQVPGPNRPYNFFGVVSKLVFDEVERVLRDGCLDERPTILFSHFPSSILVFEKKGWSFGRLNAVCAEVRRAKGLPKRPAFLAYLSGHLHSAFDSSGEGTLSNMPGKYVEMQLGDLRHSHVYRILVLDHGVLYWKTPKLSTAFPIVLVTNPAPGSAAYSSTHVRMFVFRSPEDRDGSKTRLVEVKIDGRLLGMMPSNVDLPLHLIAWDPSQYASEIHTLEVFIDGSKTPAETVTFTASPEGIVPYPPNKLSRTFWCLSNFPDQNVVLAKYITITVLIFLLLPPGKCPLALQTFASLRHRRRPSWVLLVLAGAVLLVAPLVISRRFYSPAGFGYGSLLSLSSYSVRAADTAVVVAIPHIVLIYLPLVYLTVASLSPSRRLGARWSTIDRGLRALAWLAVIYRSLMWTAQVWAAYGLFAMLFSPSALPTVILAGLVSFANYETGRSMPSAAGEAAKE